MSKFKTAIAVAVGTLFAGAAFAQSSYSIEQRDRIEQARIERGIESGRLTPREAARLQSGRAQVERLERRGRADGVLTQYERARIDHAQDRLSRDIYRESHDRQVAGSNWRTPQRPRGWDRHDGIAHGHFDRGGRVQQFDRRGAVHVERFGSHANGVAMRGGSEARFGRSDWAPGRQPHLHQTEAQRTQVQQAQGQRSWMRPAPTSGTNATLAHPAAQQAQTQRSWTQTARTSTTVTAAKPGAQQAQAQRSWTRTARTSTTAAAASPVTVARQGGYGGRHTR